MSTEEMFFFGPTPEHMDALAGALQRAGFLIEEPCAPPPYSGCDQCVTVVIPGRPLGMSEAMAHGYFEEFAREYGCEFDGFGHDMTGPVAW